MKCERWPFRPIHITNDGQQAPEGSPLRRLTGPGIIANTYLQGIQSAICHNLGYPTTIIEFSPDGEPVRTDSPLLAYQMVPAYRRFWDCTSRLSAGGDQKGGYLCRKSDACHARLLWGLRASELPTRLPTEPPLSGCVGDFYRGAPRCDFSRVTESGGHSFLVYDCPLLGYREALFPILFEDAVIGAFFLGQVVLEQKKDFIEERIKTLLSRHAHCFDEYIDREGGSQRPEDILGAILEQHREWTAQPRNVLTQQKHEYLLSATCGALANLEHQLQTEMREQRQRYIGEQVTARIEQFRRDLPPDVPRDPDPLKPLWDDVARTFGGIVDDFALRYVVVFGATSLTGPEQSVLGIVARAGSLPDQFSDPQNVQRIKLDLVGLPPESYTQITYASRLRNPEHFERLRNCDLGACGDVVFVFLPVPLHTQSLHRNPGRLLGPQSKRISRERSGRRLGHGASVFQLPCCFIPLGGPCHDRSATYSRPASHPRARSRSADCRP